MEAQKEAQTHINTLLWQEIFNTVQSVKFVVLLTPKDLEEYERDEFDYEIHNVIDVLEKLAALTDKHMGDIFESVLPVMS